MIRIHERSSGQEQIEWSVLPEIFTLSAAALEQTRFLVSALGGDEKKMCGNIDVANEWTEPKQVPT